MKLFTLSIVLVLLAVSIQAQDGSGDRTGGLLPPLGGKGGMAMGNGMSGSMGRSMGSGKGGSEGGSKGMGSGGIITFSGEGGKGMGMGMGGSMGGSGKGMGGEKGGGEKGGSHGGSGKGMGGEKGGGENGAIHGGSGKGMGGESGKAAAMTAGAMVSVLPTKSSAVLAVSSVAVLVAGISLIAARRRHKLAGYAKVTGLEAVPFTTYGTHSPEPLDV